MVKVKLRDRTVEVDRTSVKVEKLLLQMCINPEDVLVLKNGRLITEDTILKDGDEIEIYEVISRG